MRSLKVVTALAILNVLTVAILGGRGLLAFGWPWWIAVPVQLAAIAATARLGVDAVARAGERERAAIWQRIRNEPQRMQNEPGE